MGYKLSILKPILGFLPLLLLVSAVTVLVLWPRTQVVRSDGGQWTCSMHPQIRMDNPGKCPLCGMDLVPITQLKSLDERAGIETEEVKRRELFRDIRTVGKIDYNEAHVAYITARIEGRVDRLYVDFSGVDVELNDHLVDIYSPSLLVEQEALLRALDAVERQRSGSVQDRFVKLNLDSTREKLRLWGILPEQIAEFEATRNPREHVTLYSPIQGTVIEKNIRAGQYVTVGDLLYRIAKLDPIWLYLDIYEYDIAWVRYGQYVDVALEAFPGETMRGMVTLIDPFLNEATRTVKVRVNLPNADRRLKPGMYASASIRVPLNADGSAAPTGLEGKFACPMHPEVIQDQAGTCGVCQMELKQVPHRGPFEKAGQRANQDVPGEHAGHEAPPTPPATSQPSLETPSPAERTAAAASLPLAIRASAVLDTGRRRIAYRQRSDGAFELVELVVGPRAVGTDDTGQSTIYFTVLDGINDGDQVVVRAGFLLDSQRQIEGMPSLFFPQGAAPPAGHSGHDMQGAAPATEPRDQSDMDRMKSELQKLSPEDQASAERQHVCPVTGKMLGTMGPPEKVEVRGRTVWICCPECKEELLNNADKYLAKLGTR